MRETDRSACVALDQGTVRPSDVELRDDEFWRATPAYARVDRKTFLDHRWQAAHSVTTPQGLMEVAGGLIGEAERDDLAEGLNRAPMAIRLTPYLLSLIDWADFASDPLRLQYLPLRRERVPDHPRLRLDPLLERESSPVPGLTHRHSHAVLFLVVESCPVYCRFCTRSYLVGLDTETLAKDRLGSARRRWRLGLDYIRAHPEVEDVVLSGGDVYQLKPEQILDLGRALLDVPHVRRIRLATKGPAAAPMKLLSHPEWVAALVRIAAEGRRRHKQVCLHAHFSHPREITDVTRRGLERLFEGGVTMRSQSVLLRGVNDDAATMESLVCKLARTNVHAYYVYQQDMVPGVEDLRTPLHVAIELEKRMRGTTAGFHTPTFVVDLTGGGGKRDVHSYESYDRTTGISVYRSPSVDPEARYLHFDPIPSLPPAGRARWTDPEEQAVMVREALGETPR